MTPAGTKPKLPPRPPRRPTGPATESALSTCIWCRHAAHSSGRRCPAYNDTFHGCGKRGHWQQVCRASSANVVSNVEQNLSSESQPTYFITHDVCQVLFSLNGLFVNLDLSTPAAKPSFSKRLRFQVDSGCSSNTIHVTDLNNLSPVQVNPSPVRVLDNSKTVISTRGQATLQCTRCGKAYNIVVQIITAQRYYPPLLGLADSTQMGIIIYNVNTANQLEDLQAAPPPVGELLLNCIKQANPELG